MMKYMSKVLMLALLMAVSAASVFWLSKPKNADTATQDDTAAAPGVVEVSTPPEAAIQPQEMPSDDPNNEAVKDISQEYVKDLTTSSPRDGGPASGYMRAMAPLNRSEEFGASAKPRPGYESLFTAFEVSSQEIADYVHPMTFTLTRLIPSNDKKPAEFKRTDPVEVNVGEALKKGELMTSIYDIYLSKSQDTLIQQRLLMSFLEKHALIPDRSRFSHTTSNYGGETLLIIKFPGGTTEELIDSHVDSSEIDRRALKSIESMRKEMGVKAFASQINSFLADDDSKKYFPNPDQVSEKALIVFLKSKADISARTPPVLKK